MGFATQGAVSRDHTKLRVFGLAQQLALDVYKATDSFPASERYGLQSQIRRASVSVVTNIVEGSARRGERDYIHFLNIATGSAAETLSLIHLAAQINLLADSVAPTLEARYTVLVKSLKKLVDTLDSMAP